MNNLTSKTFQGLKWTTFATVLTAIMQIGYTAVMARVLDASDFGLVALGNVALRFAGYFSNMGLSQAIIQKSKIDKNDINAAFSFALLLGSFFFFLLYFLAPTISTVAFKNEELISIIRVLAIGFILTSLSSISLSLIKRQLKFKVLSQIEVFSYLFSYGIVGIGMAYFGFGVWSLIFATLSQGVIVVIFSQIVASHRFALIFKWKFYKPLFSYGSRISFINFLGFLSTNSDTMVIGRTLGPSILGVYNRAFALINLPAIFFTQSISKVLFPAMSTVQSDKEKLKKVYKMSISSVGYILFPACFGASIASEEIVLTVLGDKWVESVAILSILALATPFNLLTVFAGIICEVTAKLKAKIIFQTIFLTTMLSLFYFLHGYGLKGFAFSILIANFTNHVIYTIFIKKLLAVKFKEIIAIYAPGILTSLLTAGFIYLDKYAMDMMNMPLAIVFISEVMVGAIVLIASLLLPINTSVRNNILENLSHISKNEKLVNKIKAYFN